MLLVHCVYFSLKDRLDKAKQKLMAASRENLSSHPGIVFSAVGALAGEYARTGMGGAGKIGKSSVSRGSAESRALHVGRETKMCPRRALSLAWQGVAPPPENPPIWLGW